MIEDCKGIPSLLYLGPCLGPCSILVTASSGSVYVCSCCGCRGCCGVAGAAIGVAGDTAIGTTYSTAVEIAGGIGGAFCRASYRASYCGASYRACWRDGVCIDGAYTGGACPDETYCGA